MKERNNLIFKEAIREYLLKCMILEAFAQYTNTIMTCIFLKSKSECTRLLAGDGESRLLERYGNR